MKKSIISSVLSSHAQVLQEPIEGIEEKKGLADYANKYRPSLLSYAYRLIGNQADAEDIVQEALCRACEKVDLLKTPSDVSKWLKSFIINVSKEKIRENTKNKAVPIVDIDGFATDDGFAEEVIAQIASEEFSRKLREKYPIHASVLLDDKSTKEIALEMNTSTGNVRVLKHRELEKIKLELKQNNNVETNFCNDNIKIIRLSNSIEAVRLKNNIQTIGLRSNNVKITNPQTHSALLCRAWDEESRCDALCTSYACIDLIERILNRSEVRAVLTMPITTEVLAGLIAKGLSRSPIGKELADHLFQCTQCWEDFSGIVEIKALQAGILILDPSEAIH